jgi:ATP-dependent RNA helicase DeaD
VTQDENTPGTDEIPSGVDETSSEVTDAAPEVTEPSANIIDAAPASDAEVVVEEATPEIVAAVEAPSGFEGLGLRPELLRALTNLGYEEPTPIQRETIPVLLEGHDLVGQAATGTGKTAAFALPILQLLPERGSRIVPVALVLVPTRELAVQVSEAIYKYGKELGVKVVPVYGGQPIGRQLKALDDGVHVVVATPGRALDHISRGTLPLDDVRIVVLDEADEMLDMGFAEDIEEILKSTPTTRQTVMFSATMPPRINGIAKRHLTNPVKIQTGLGDATTGKTPRVRELAYVVMRSHKPAALGRILDVEAPTAAIVFCRTRIEVDQLTETMNGRGYRAEALHGGMTQEQREKVMNRLRSGTTDLLLATDVAARGLDIDQLSHVVNYDVPSAPEAYVHRIGRVGRAGRSGVAITLAEPREQRLLANIERLTKHKIAIEKVPTVADLRARQIELTVATLREALGGIDLADYDVVVDALAEEFDMRSIALAGIKLSHFASGATVDEKEIPDVMARLERDRAAGKVDADGRTIKPGRKEYNKGERSDGPTTLLYLSLGMKDGIRPGDLVGALANETNLSGAQIGPIKVNPTNATVGVPADQAQAVIAAMSHSTIRGHKATFKIFDGDGKPWQRDDRKSGGSGDRPYSKPSGDRSYGDRKSGGGKSFGGGKSYDKPAEKQYGERPKAIDWSPPAAGTEPVARKKSAFIRAPKNG